MQEMWVLSLGQEDLLQKKMATHPSILAWKIPRTEEPGATSLVVQMVKNLPVNAGDVGLIPGSERFHGGGNGNPPQYSCLGNPMDRGVWRATVHGVAESCK